MSSPQETLRLVMKTGRLGFGWKLVSLFLLFFFFHLCSNTDNVSHINLFLCWINQLSVSVGFPQNQLKVLETISTTKCCFWCPVFFVRRGNGISLRQRQYMQLSWILRSILKCLEKIIVSSTAHKEETINFLLPIFCFLHTFDIMALFKNSSIRMWSPRCL